MFPFGRLKQIFTFWVSTVRRAGILFGISICCRVKSDILTYICHVCAVFIVSWDTSRAYSRGVNDVDRRHWVCQEALLRGFVATRLAGLEIFELVVLVAFVTVDAVELSGGAIFLTMRAEPELCFMYSHLRGGGVELAGHAELLLERGSER